MNTLKDLVLHLLHVDSEFRDDKKKLYATFVKYYYDGNWKKFALDDCPVSITRYWAYWQSKYPELRGSNWAERQAHSKTKAKELRSQERPENLHKWYQFWK